MVKYKAAILEALREWADVKRGEEIKDDDDNYYAVLAVLEDNGLYDSVSGNLEGEQQYRMARIVEPFKRSMKFNCQKYS